MKKQKWPQGKILKHGNWIIECDPTPIPCDERCKHCGAAIAWGKIEEVKVSVTCLNDEEIKRLHATKGRWMPLDADGMRHRCGAIKKGKP